MELDFLEVEEVALAVIDVQGKLADQMDGRDRLFERLTTLIRALQILNVPILWTEQVPEKLGPTVPQIAELLVDEEPVSKSTFSCGGDDLFVTRLEELGRNTVILAGIEAHVCVYQTALDLLLRGYRVEVLRDAVSSRTAENRRAGLERMKALGAGILTVEMLLFELQKEAGGETFRELVKLVK